MTNAKGVKKIIEESNFLPLLSFRYDSYHIQKPKLQPNDKRTNLKTRK